MSMQWSPSLSVGIAEIDAQHKELFGQIQLLHAALSAGRAADQVAPMFDFLETYVREHFAAEEAEMDRMNYPQRRSHKASHAEFIAELQRLRAELDQVGPGPEMAVRLQRRLRDWLVGHIGIMDREFGQFVGRRPAGG